jgi:hypothetical protein
LNGYWKKVHGAPKILVCKGRFDGMNKVIQAFASNSSENINKLAENLEKNEYERD